MMSSACLSLFGNALSVKTRELQGKLHKRLEEVDKDESLANVSSDCSIEYCFRQSDHIYIFRSTVVCAGLCGNNLLLSNPTHSFGSV